MTSLVTRVGYSSESNRKKTVGITLPTELVKQARKHRLNISRVTEQALLSVIDYLENSKPINIPKYESISGTSQGPVVQWNECRPRTAEVAGSNPARSTLLLENGSVCAHQLLRG